MLSMLSQMSSSQSRIETFQYAAPQPPKMGMWTRVATVGAGILFALVVVNSISGITQAFGIA